MGKITPIRYHLALVLKSLHFPLTYPSINDSLKKRGYTLTESSLRLVPSVPLGARSYLSGRIATKEECYVDIDADRKFIATEGRNTKKVIETFNDLVNMSKEDFNVSGEEFDYCELIASFSAPAIKNSMESIKKTLKNELYVQVSKILKSEVSPYTVTFAPSKGMPSDKIWFHIKIEPEVTMPKKAYDISVIYRHEDKNDVLSFTSEVESKILEIINLIEG